MDIQTVAQLIPVLQMAIGPVILISGIGLLLLTMTNRYGRVIDRARLLVDDLPQVNEDKKAKTIAQLLILWKRAKSIRIVIALSSLSALSAAFLIIILFITALWQIETSWLIMVVFGLCMLSLISSLILFIYDMNKSLSALKLELETEGIDEV